MVDYHAAINLPSGMDAQKAVPLFCAGITAYNAVRSPELLENNWLGVIGCGGLGQMGTLIMTLMSTNTDSGKLLGMRKL